MLQEPSVLTFLFIIASMYGLMMIIRDFVYWLKYLPRRLQGMSCCTMCAVWDSVIHWFRGCHRLPRVTVIKGVEYINTPVKTIEPSSWFIEDDHLEYRKR